MRRTFWPNRIFQRFKSKSRSTGLKFTPIREKSSRLSMKIVQNVLFRPSVGRCGQIAFFNVLDQKIGLPDWNSREYVKTVGFPWKLNKTCFSGNADDVLGKSHFSTFSHWPEILSKKGKQCAFHENCTKRAFQAMRRTCWPNRIFQRFRSKITPPDWNSRQYVKTVGFP